MVKQFIRALGVDDTSFQLRADAYTSIVGAVYRGRGILEDVLTSIIEVDGLDSTEKIVEMIKGSKHLNQLRAIFLSGITFGGFNTVNIKELYQVLKIPVIVILEKKPDYERIKVAASRTKNYDRIITYIKEAGEVTPVQTSKGRIYIQLSGSNINNALKLISLFQVNSKIPEPLRVAQLIAKIFKRENTLIKSS
ncbi:MAG: DUF99 family protein [Candidatus Odinarchaeum yellowstonii]|uniref:UPF0215 protein OdinLCB4_003930 n=1 Tax=Odinarchaeota yellowstonii (strain LCB_4) TaxID=1841599 RepID=A0AAF0D0Q3_ODILC|nr:MAG: DUF99 family protein [Candidatus Odinarchaeum yellowstonii]